MYLKRANDRTDDEIDEMYSTDSVPDMSTTPATKTVMSDMLRCTESKIKLIDLRGTSDNKENKHERSDAPTKMLERQVHIKRSV